ncbi:MAG: hypothetical protein JST84_21435 [Acidobacteria bacterium]|nr:hypothetical protein [Acidobacteriota bacterium]
MSHHTMQKLVVRMLFDEAFVNTVHQNPDEALARLTLTESERAQLLSIDRRAWRHDALRRRRTLRTLAEEYKISTTIVLAETRSLASQERFFSSDFFHTAVQNRGSMGIAFSEFLLEGCRQGAWKAPQISDVVRLEAAIAACRRSLEREEPPGELPADIHDRMRVKLAPGCSVASFQANIIETIQHVERYLFELSLMPAMALCEDAPRLVDLPEVDQLKKVYLLFSPGTSGISLTNIDRASFLLLYEARRPVEIKSLLTKPGATKTVSIQMQEALSEWLESGVLMVVE